MFSRARAVVTMGLFGLAGLSAPALAAGPDNALASADDAFGTSVGKETSGIYTDKETRGFNPLDAGNARIDGLYYDPVGTLSSRLRASTAIRVGLAAAAFPFGAPTGIADYHFRTMPADAGASVSLRAGSFWDHFIEADLRLPLADGKVGLTGGFSLGGNHRSNGWRSQGGTVSFRPIFHLGGVEFAPFVSKGWTNRDWSEPLAYVDGPWLPKPPPRSRLLSQPWTFGAKRQLHLGGTLKASLGDRVFAQAGLFHSRERRRHLFSEVFAIENAESDANHIVVAEPDHDVHSTSGEGRLTWLVGGSGTHQRLIAGVRFRDRVTQFGGSDIRSFGIVPYGERVIVTKPDLHYGPITEGRVRQSEVMLGYLGDVGGFAHLNLGVQRAMYRSRLLATGTGARAGTKANAWLYNAVATVDLSNRLSLYAGTQKGLEDSGAAPETAANRNQQLPATLARQYEAGMRAKFAAGTVVVSVFQITKPYFTYDLGRIYTRLGAARLRGLEGSITLHPTSRLSLLAGAVAMQSRVSGEGVRNHEIGPRPVGKAGFRARLDASYRSGLFGGLEPTLAVAYTGRRAAGSAPQPELGGRQLMAPAFTAVDIGFRQPFVVVGIPASLRLNVENAFDAKAWKVVAADTIFPEERRRFQVTLFADF